MTLTPIGNSKNQITSNNNIRSEFIVGGVLVCIIAALFKSNIIDFFQIKNNPESATAQSNEPIDINQIQIIEEEQNRLKELENKIKKIEQELQELEKFNETTTISHQMMTGVDPLLVSHILKTYQKPEEIEAKLFENLVRMTPEMILSFTSAYLMKSYCRDQSTDIEKYDFKNLLELSGQIPEHQSLISKKIIRHMSKLSPQDQKVIADKLLTITANHSRFVQSQLKIGSSLSNLNQDSVSARYARNLCINHANLDVFVEFNRSSRRNQMNNSELKYIVECHKQTEKFSDEIQELEEIAQSLNCSTSELLIRFSPRVKGNSEEEIACSDHSIYDLLKNAKDFLQNQLLEEENEKEQRAKHSKVRQEERNRALKLQRNREEQAQSIRNKTREEKSAAVAVKPTEPKRIVSNNLRNLSRQTNQSIGASNGFKTVPFRNEAPSRDNSIKINFNEQVLVASRVLRWDCPSHCSSEDFLSKIKNFTDKNSTQKYLRMSPEELMNQQRRHSIPHIEILLAQKWFLKNYALKVHHPDNPSSENFFLLVESFLEKKSLGVEILSIALNRDKEEPLLYHCFIHPKNTLLTSKYNHSFFDNSEIPQNVATPLPSKRSSSENILFLDQVDGSRRIQVSGQDFFTDNKRTIVFLPINFK